MLKHSQYSKVPGSWWLERKGLEMELMRATDWKKLKSRGLMMELMQAVEWKGPKERLGDGVDECSRVEENKGEGPFEVVDGEEGLAEEANGEEELLHWQLKLVQQQRREERNS